MKKAISKNVTTLDEILDKKYGKKGAPNVKNGNRNSKLSD